MTYSLNNLNKCDVTAIEIIYKDNRYMTALAEDEYEDCFIKGI